MPVMKWDNLRVFLAVARAGQLLGAAQKLGQDQATVSRHIRALEAALDTRLFQRSQAGVLLTSAGERLLPIAERMETEALQAVSTIGRDEVELSGTIRIGAPDGFGTYFLAPLLAELSITHPGLRLQLVPLPRSFSLMKREADIAITLDRPTEPSLIARKLTDYTLGLYTTRRYLAEVGAITSIDDLARCLFVTYVQDMIFSPQLTYGETIMARAGQVFECASVVGQMQALRQGGVGYVHDYASPSAPELVRILPANAVKLTYWIVVHRSTQTIRRMNELSSAIRARVDAARGSFIA
ncbi:MAG: LysR family transcriptional regulator [Pseudomonadota bacterium]